MNGLIALESDNNNAEDFSQGPGSKPFIVFFNFSVFVFIDTRKK